MRDPRGHRWPASRLRVDTQGASHIYSMLANGEGEARQLNRQEKYGTAWSVTIELILQGDFGNDCLWQNKNCGYYSIVSALVAASCKNRSPPPHHPHLRHSAYAAAPGTGRLRCARNPQQSIAAGSDAAMGSTQCGEVQIEAGTGRCTGHR